MTLANQAAIAMENIKLYEHAQDLAALQERQRLARELHDAVTQTLFSTSVIADVLPRIWERDPSEGRRNLEDLRQLTRSALAEMRMLLLELRPAELLKLRLPELLTQLVDAMRSRLRVPIALHRRGTCEVPPDVQVMLYRVAQEALNNIAKHAAASEVRVELECTDRGVVLRIGDNGRGFDPRHVPGNHWGVGIMRERAEAVGATLEVCSAWRRGTEITVRWHAPTGAGGV
jgi:two-component system nitrate/nitrite sensor histidine kinase NarX